MNGKATSVGSLDRKLQEAWDATQLSHAAKVSRFRRYCDLHVDEKSVVRKLYEEGNALDALAMQIGIFPGSLRAAVESEGWKQSGNRASFASQIAGLLRKHPKMAAKEVAERIGCKPAYVYKVRQKRKQSQPKPPRRRPGKKRSGEMAGWTMDDVFVPTSYPAGFDTDVYTIVGDHSAEGCE